MVLDPVETLVANVRPLRFHGERGDVRPGTKHFVGGALVTFKNGHRGMGADVVTLIGRHRKSKRLITVDMQRRHLTNWRAKVVYSPEVIARVTDGHHELRTKDEWLATAQHFNSSWFVYAFERPVNELQTLIEQWADEPGTPRVPRLEGQSTATAIAYRNSPSEPIGLALLAEDRTATTYLVSGLDDAVEKDAKRAMLVKLGIVNQRNGQTQGLRHRLVKWHHDNADDPVRVYSEIDAAGWEIRKVEQYGDGRYDAAAPNLETGSTRLTATQIPSIAAISEDDLWSLIEIKATTFESIWVTANQ